MGCAPPERPYRVQTCTNIDEDERPKVRRWNSKWKCGIRYQVGFRRFRFDLSEAVLSAKTFHKIKQLSDLRQRRLSSRFCLSISMTGLKRRLRMKRNSIEL